MSSIIRVFNFLFSGSIHPDAIKFETVKGETRNATEIINELIDDIDALNKRIEELEERL